MRGGGIGGFRGFDGGEEVIEFRSSVVRPGVDLIVLFAHKLIYIWGMSQLYFFQRNGPPPIHKKRHTAFLPAPSSLPLATRQSRYSAIISSNKKDPSR
mmetsp:Transcript_24898/g.52130  ORF Transcript_24898/g.52130 Transcript_24898/m.52130 type:complete len:98 (+) Transcript_24898:153-446(+)